MLHLFHKGPLILVDVVAKISDAKARGDSAASVILVQREQAHEGIVLLGRLLNLGLLL